MEALRSESKAEGGSLPRSVVSEALSAPAQPVAPCVPVGPPMVASVALDSDILGWLDPSACQSFKSDSSGARVRLFSLFFFAGAGRAVTLRSPRWLSDATVCLFFFVVLRLAFVFLWVHVFFEHMALDLLKYTRAPGPFLDRKGMAPHGCMVCRLMYAVHQTLSLGPGTVTVSGAACHNRWGVAETPLPAKTQGRTLDCLFPANAYCCRVAFKCRFKGLPKPHQTLGEFQWLLGGERPTRAGPTVAPLPAAYAWTRARTRGSPTGVRTTLIPLIHATRAPTQGTALLQVSPQRYLSTSTRTAWCPSWSW